MPELVERSDPEGVDYGWVMQVTFVVTIAAGAPVVAALSTLADLSTWSARAAFAIRVGAVVWFLTAVAVYLYARRTQVEGATTASDAEVSERTADARGGDADGAKSTTPSETTARTD